MDDFQKCSSDIYQNTVKQEITSSAIEIEGNDELDSMREEANQASLINDPNFNSNSKEYDKSSSNYKEEIDILPEDLELSVVTEKSTSIQRRESSEEIQKLQTNLKSYDSVVRPSNSFNFEPDLNFKTKSLSLFDKMNLNEIGKSTSVLNNALGSSTKKNSILNQISSLRQLEIIKKPLTHDSEPQTQNINHININFNNYNVGNCITKELQSPQENKLLPKSNFSSKLMSVYNELSNKPNDTTKKIAYGQDRNSQKDSEFYQDQFDKFYSNFKSRKKDGIRSNLTFGINSGCASSMDFKKNSKVEPPTIKNKLSNQHQTVEKISSRVNETFKNQADFSKSKFKDNPKFNKFEMLMSTDFKNLRQDQFMLKDEMVDLDEEIMKFRKRHINNKNQEQSSIQEEASQLNFEDNEANEIVSSEDDWNKIISRNNEFSPEKGELK